MRPRRALAFALVPLSALPLAVGAPLVAPSLDKRVQELRERSPERVRARVEAPPPRARRERRDGRRAERVAAKRRAAE